MDHKAHIGFVNTHTESNGSHNNVDILHQEIILCLSTCSRIQSSMIGCSSDIVGLQDSSKLFHLLPRQTVDNTALSGMLFDELDDILIYILCLGTYFIIKVRTIKRALELHCIHNSQVFLNVATHLICRSSSQSYDRCLTYLINNRTDSTILRTEVMTPLRDTMCLINSIERYLDRFQELYIILFRQRFRCNIQQLGVTCKDIRLHLIDSRLVQRRVQVVSSTLMLTEVTDDIHLVLHQCNQRRDNNGRSLHQQ